MAEVPMGARHWRKVVVGLAVSCAVSLVCAVVVCSSNLTASLGESSRTTTESFTAIMDEYVRAFEQYEQLVQLEVSAAGSEDEIAAFLKSKDATLGAIEGGDYDGVYLYYHGRYLYSWDTPYSEYESNGYDATTRAWYTGAMEANGDICFSVPYRSFANDYLLATISRMQPDGETVIAYDLKLGAIQNYVSQLSSQYPGSLELIVDADGNIIGSTDQRLAGGNYHATAQELADQRKAAEDELAQVDEDGRQKAQAKVDSIATLSEFVASKGACLDQTMSRPNSLVFDFAAGTVAFTQGNDRYSTITLIPIVQLLPMFAGTWLGLWVVLALAILLVENLVQRRRSAVTLEETNARLAEAVVAADAANAAKSQFLAQMSHEIRTPMNAVIGLTTIAKTEVRSPDKVLEYLMKIEGSSRLLLGIINDVLDMSAIEGGKLKIDSAHFNFRSMITNITTLFYEQTRQKGIRFEVRMNGVTEEDIVGDELRVNQVLMNLLSNAVKFTPAGGEIDLMVLQASRSQGKVQLRFSVSDTGCGMSEEMLGRLFKPFEQESASTARKHGGSGLGLSIAKRLTEMMGGSLKVQSTQGKGTVFTADIPFGVEEGEDYSSQVTDFSTVRALVVDDDKESCEYSGILLERLGVRHEYVTSGEAALEALDEAEDSGDPFTLCLIDWRMPEMDGGQLTRQIREIFGEDAIIIIVSAYDLDEMEASGRDLGANYFIPKPLFQSTLFNALMRITGGDYTRIEAQHENEDYDFAGKHVMVVEDVAMNMEVAVKLLKMVGVEATCAEDGRQAVDLFRQSAPGTFDCILMDINMPIMDGYEAARAIRQYPRPDAKTIPIYAMTANAFAEDVTSALDAGMNGHIAKPIETKVLYHTLAEVFKPAEEGADGPAAADADGTAAAGAGGTAAADAGGTAATDASSTAATDEGGTAAVGAR